MEDEEKIIPVYQKDLHGDNIRISFRIPNEGFEHGDLIHISVEHIENINDTSQAGDQTEKNNKEENGDMDRDNQEGS